MKLRVLMMIACLFAMATAAQAQSISATTVRSLQGSDTPVQTQSPYRVQIGVGVRIAVPTVEELTQLEARAEQLANQPILPAWLTEAIQNGMANLHKLRTSDGCATVTSKKPCCEAELPGVVKGSGIVVSDQCFKDVLVKVQETRTSGLMLPVQACAESTVIRHLVKQIPCCGIKDFMQFTCPIQFKVMQGSPPCCCAKACTCCETCKAKPTAAKASTLTPRERAIEYRLKQPITLNFRDVSFRQAIKDMSVQSGVHTVVDGSVLMQMRGNLDMPISLRLEDVPMGVALERVLSPLKLSFVIENDTLKITSGHQRTDVYRHGSIDVVQLQAIPSGSPPPVMIPAGPSIKPLPRFETPDLEVHCEKMMHRGDTVVFEGSVMLLSKKHSQPIRVNAQRVTLNLKDGSYSVESTPGSVSMPMPPLSSFGVLRSSAVECMPPTCPTESADRPIVIAVPGLPMNMPWTMPIAPSSQPNGVYAVPVPR